jgi:hypothetical protein
MILNRTPEPESHTRVVLSLGITAVATKRLSPKLRGL